MMPRNKDLKRLVRGRMQKTGESYTTARAQVVRKKAPHRANFARLAGMSDTAVSNKTGRTWSQWVEVLDGVDATAMTHTDIAAQIHKEFGVSGWWAQTVTVGYERIKALRAVGQRRDGTHEANKSKTVNVPLDKLYQAFSTKRLRQKWLPGIDLTIRKSTHGKSMRLTWEDGTPVEAYFTAKSQAKSQVSIQHRKLATKTAAEKAKTYWGERLEALAGLLTGE